MPILMEDNVAVVSVHTWELNGVYFEGDITSGPVPIFFAEDVEKAAECLDADPDRVLEDHTKLMRR